MSSPRRVWIDADVGTDDAHALLMALSCPDLQILGISSVYGNTTAHNAALNVLRVLNVADRLDIPVHAGVDKSLNGTEATSEFHGRDGFGGAADKYPVDESRMNVQEIHAVHALIKAAADHPGEVTLITLGPVTNIAIAMRLDPSLSKTLQHCYIMGGTMFGEGNITASAEFNFHCDPEAANVLLTELECPVTVVPWEACIKSAITWDFNDEMVSAETEKAKLIRDITEHVVKNSKNVVMEKFPRADPTAMAVALSPSIVTKSVHKSAKVMSAGTETRGTVVVDWRHRFFSDQIRVEFVEEIDQKTFERMLSTCLQ